MNNLKEKTCFVLHSGKTRLTHSNQVAHRQVNIKCINPYKFSHPLKYLVIKVWQIVNSEIPIKEVNQHAKIWIQILLYR